MNQLLNSSKYDYDNELKNELNKKKYDKYKKNKINKYISYMQLYFSILLLFIISIFILGRKFILNKKENYSTDLLNNYKITKLYSNLSSTLEVNLDENSFKDSSIFGIIEIPKINVRYPIFSSYNEELLKVSPCKFYGPNPGKKGNLCIAGHNYDNNKFFSKISSLENNDIIIVYDDKNNKYQYNVSDIYEVNQYDFSPIYSYNKKYKQLTLITCNNFNNNRIIVKAYSN